MAACTSTPSPSDDPPPATPDRFDSIPCGATIDDLCSSSLGCDRTLEQAKHDPLVCDPPVGAFLAACGDFVIVGKMGTDTGMESFYKDGQLFAMLRSSIATEGCFAGPATFERPICSSGTTIPLPACPAH